MPLFEIREEETWTAVIREIYHSYQGVRTQNIYQIEADTEEEALSNYRRQGTFIEELDERYDDYSDSEYVDSEGEVGRELEDCEVLEITNLSEDLTEEEQNLFTPAPKKNPDHDWEV